MRVFILSDQNEIVGVGVGNNVSVLKIVVIGRVQFLKVKKRVKAVYKNEWEQRITVKYT